MRRTARARRWTPEEASSGCWRSPRGRRFGGEGDGAALVNAIGELLANPLRAAGFGASARKRVEAEYSRDAMRRRFEEFYRGLAG